MRTEPEQLIQDVLDKNPDVRLVLEIAARALEVESKEPPLSNEMASDTVAQPTSVQCPVPPETPC
jgi:hypothetical protein